ncbi:MAG: hypothetical protein ABSH47_09020 [Bryobacteraceae bacterium]|jgi:hypothetical protein
MDGGDRKYRQRGYQDSDRPTNGQGRDDKPRPAGPKPSIDITGPRLPRLLQTVAAARCYNCSTMLPADVDFKGNCPKCNTPLHCCKQCSHFDTSTRFQCVKPILVRIAVKDQANECELFRPRVTVARDAASIGAQTPPAITRNSTPAPRSSQDARAAFDNLFKK